MSAGLLRRDERRFTVGTVPFRRIGVTRATLRLSGAPATAPAPADGRRLPNVQHCRVDAHLAGRGGADPEVLARKGGSTCGWTTRGLGWQPGAGSLDPLPSQSNPNPAESEGPRAARERGMEIASRDPQRSPSLESIRCGDSGQSSMGRRPRSPNVDIGIHGVFRHRCSLRKPPERERGRGNTASSRGPLKRPREGAPWRGLTVRPSSSRTTDDLLVSPTRGDFQPRSAGSHPVRVFAL